MTRYSGIDLVKQEECKLTYASFLADVIKCYNRTANILTLYNPYSFETTYDADTKTISNSAFELRAVEPTELSDITDYKLVLSLDDTTTGLELILKADTYRKKKVISRSHLAICDTFDFTYSPYTYPYVYCDDTDEDASDTETPDNCSWPGTEWPDNWPPTDWPDWPEFPFPEWPPINWPDIPDPENPEFPSFPDWPDYPNWPPDVNWPPVAPTDPTYPEYPDWPNWPEYPPAPLDPDFPDWPGFPNWPNFPSWPPDPSNPWDPNNWPPKKPKDPGPGLGCEDLPIVYTQIEESDFDLVYNTTYKTQKYLTINEFKSFIDCYDELKQQVIITNPYLLETTYDHVTRILTTPGFIIENVSLDVCNDSIKLAFSLPASSKEQFDVILNTTSNTKVTHSITTADLSQCPSKPCFNDFGTFEILKPCEELKLNDEELPPCYTVDKPLPMPRKKGTIVSNCAEDEVCTDTGCVKKEIIGFPCGQPCDSLDYTQAPALMFMAADFSYNLVNFLEYTIYPDGDVVGNFIIAIPNVRDTYMYIKMFNFLDYISPRVYTDGEVTKTIDILYFIATKYLNIPAAEAWGLANQGLTIPAMQLASIFSGIGDMRFNWATEIDMLMSSNIKTNTSPCKYVKGVITNSIDGSTNVNYYYKFSNQYIPSITHTDLDISAFESDYNDYCDTVKWLISEDAYAYAVYQGYINPGTTFNY